MSSTSPPNSAVALSTTSLSGSAAPSSHCIGAQCYGSYDRDPSRSSSSCVPDLTFTMNSSNGGATEVMPTVAEDGWGNGSSYMMSSTGSMANSRSQTSHIAKTYRQAANLYLTRRLPEALSTIEAIVLPQPSSPYTNGDSNGDAHAQAPVASASKGTRTKVWSFYLTFLNSVVELGPEEGKHAFGSVRWKSLVAKCREGTVWDDVVRDGYGGNEGAVDSDVVINLATLLLTHSPDQKLNQQKLENYFAATSQPTLDISSAFSQPSRHHFGMGGRRPSAHASGTNTPRDLNSNIKLLELYTLHVLPRNDEWDYAREFILMSEVLDDERKEAFLHALQGLKEESEGAKQKEKELQRLQREQLEEQRRKAEEDRQAEARRAEEEAMTTTTRRNEERRRPPDESSPGSKSNGSRVLPAPSSPTSRPRPSAGIPSSSSSSQNKKQNSQISRTPRSPGHSSSSRPQQNNQTLYKRFSAMFSSLQTLVLNMGQGLTRNPMAMMRMLLFLLMFAFAFGRRDVRERVRRAVGRAYEKVAQTVGMGTKVSYI